MKKLFVLFSVLYLYLSHGFAATPDEVVKNMQKATDATVANYKKGGISLLVQNSERCYKEVEKYRYYCIYLDLAARHISDLDGAGVRFAPEKYFVDDAFLPRAAEIFIRSGKEKEESNEYLAMVTTVINKFVDNALAAKK